MLFALKILRLYKKKAQEQYFKQIYSSKEAKMISRGIHESELAVERRRADTDVLGVDYRKERTLGGVWERIRIRSEEGARSIGRPIGKYDTLVIGRLERSDAETILDLSDEVARELCALCDGIEAIPERVLVIGLGNPALTPDAIGCEAAKIVKPTMHISEHDRYDTYDKGEAYLGKTVLIGGD